MAHDKNHKRTKVAFTFMSAYSHLKYKNKLCKQR